MSNTTGTPRQIWLSAEIVAEVQTQKINDPRPPRQKPTLHNIFVAMFIHGLKMYESNPTSVIIERRNTTDPGYYVPTFPQTEYDRAGEIAQSTGLSVVDVIVSLIGAAAKDGFKISTL